MTNDKKLEGKKMAIIRIVIFVAISTIPVTIFALLANHALGAPMYSTNELAAHPLVMLVGYGMLCPSIANILTRLITKEGFQDLKLHINFKGNLKYYLMATVGTALYVAIGVLLVVVFFSGVRLQEIFQIDSEKFHLYIPAALSSGSFVFTSILLFFGEEFGWRGYLYPKLEKVMPLPASILVGGLIWGLWHAPLTISGHNFGTDYPGFPFVGIALMCVDCIAMGSFLTYMTRKTNSIWCAAIAHGVNNQGIGQILATLFISEKAFLAVNETVLNIQMWLVMLIPTVLVGAACFIAMCREDKRERSKQVSEGE